MHDVSKEVDLLIALYVLAMVGFDSDNDYSLSGLTQENPKYVDIIGETSDDDKSSNLSAIFECAKQLAGNGRGVILAHVKSKFSQTRFVRIFWSLYLRKLRGKELKRE